MPVSYVHHALSIPWDFFSHPHKPGSCWPDSTPASLSLGMGTEKADNAQWGPKVRGAGGFTDQKDLGTNTCAAGNASPGTVAILLPSPSGQRSPVVQWHQNKLAGGRGTFADSLRFWEWPPKGTGELPSVCTAERHEGRAGVGAMNFWWASLHDWTMLLNCAQQPRDRNEGGSLGDGSRFTTLFSVILKWNLAFHSTMNVGNSPQCQ